MRTEIGIFSPEVVCIDMVATSRFLYDGTSAPNNVSDTFSLAYGCKLSLQARSLEINDLWDPSLNNMLLSMLVPL